MDRASRSLGGHLAGPLGTVLGLVLALSGSCVLTAAVLRYNAEIDLAAARFAASGIGTKLLAVLVFPSLFMLAATVMNVLHFVRGDS